MNNLKLKRHLMTSDLKASLVVFIVAIPLSLGISLASNTPIAAGLIAAVIGGILVGSLTGAPLVVSGPAAGMIGIVLEIQESIGFTGLLWATLISGTIQLGLSFLKMGKFFYKVSGGVLNGMLAAIGFVIVAGQLHVLMGSSIPSSLWNALSSLPSNVLSNWQTAALWCGGLAVMVHVLWNQSTILSKKVPAALPAVIVSTVVSLFFDLPRVELAPLGDFALSNLSQLNLEAFRNHWGWTLLYFSLGLALVSSAESLLTARAISNLSEKRGTPFSVNLDRELLAQGTGNMLSGALGGLPITGVIIRSAANVNAGARTRLSGCFHGVWILLFVSFASLILEKIPLSALAAVLIITGIKLLNVRECISLLMARKPDGMLWVITFVAIVFSNLLAGLFIGILSQVILTRFLKNRNQRSLASDERSLQSAA